MKFSKTTLSALQILLILGLGANASTSTKSNLEKNESSTTRSKVCASSRSLLIHNKNDDDDDSHDKMEPPFVHAKILKNGQVITNIDDVPLADVYGCCEVHPPKISRDEEEEEDCEDDDTTITPNLSPQVIGTMPQYSHEDTMQVMENAKEAWNGGMGVWPQMSMKERIHRVQQFLMELQKSRQDIVDILMWEIGKNKKDAESEFDRTIEFAKNVITVLEESENNSASSSSSPFSSGWQSIGSTKAFVRRAAVGIIMCLGPYNYPLNETYATLIPALLMGNIVIMKIPTVGGLAHLLTMEAFAKALPTGTVQFVSGGGRATMPPLMAEGSIDGLAFIGGSAAADNLIQQHPHPHRLKLFLQLEAKNMGIFLPNLFQDKNEALLDSALDEAVLGSLSYNGQRCTALKLLFVPKNHAQDFTTKLVERVESLLIGLPWQKKTTTTTTQDKNDVTATRTTKTTTAYSQITPLPNHKRVTYMKQLIDDAVSKGAQIMNDKGGSIIGGSASTLMVPAVLYPVTPDMKLYKEEQFGPIVPIVPYDDSTMDEIVQYGRESEYGQQCSIFTSNSDDDIAVAASLVDQFSSIFGKININSQCGRSPDSLPFSGRRSSALGVMSVTEALREFSIPTVVAYKDKGSNTNEDIVSDIQKSSKFMESII